MSARLCNVWKKQTAADYPRAKSRNQISKGEGISGLAVSELGSNLTAMNMVTSCDYFDLTFFANKYSISVSNQNL